METKLITQARPLANKALPKIEVWWETETRSGRNKTYKVFGTEYLSFYVDICEIWNTWCIVQKLNFNAWWIRRKQVDSIDFLCCKTEGVMQITVMSIWNLHETIFASLYFINHVPFFFLWGKKYFLRFLVVSCQFNS